LATFGFATSCLFCSTFQGTAAAALAILVFALYMRQGTSPYFIVPTDEGHAGVIFRGSCVDINGGCSEHLGEGGESKDE